MNQASFMNTQSKKGGNIFDVSRPEPVSIVNRKRAPTQEHDLKLPISPAFVNNFRTAKQPDIKPVVQYCTQQNIPFKKEEGRFYKIYHAKQQHAQFNKTISQCFETMRPSEYQTGVKMMTSENPISRQDLGYINSNYCDTRPIYMPSLARDVYNKIQKREKKIEDKNTAFKNASSKQLSKLMIQT